MLEGGLFTIFLTFNGSTRMRSRTFATHAALLWHHRPHAEDQRTLRVQVFQQRASQSYKGRARSSHPHRHEERHAVSLVSAFATSAGQRSSSSSSSLLMVRAHSLTWPPAPRAPPTSATQIHLIGCRFAVRSRRANVPALSDLRTTSTSALSIQALEEVLFPPRVPICGLHFVDPSSFVEAVA